MKVRGQGTSRTGSALAPSLMVMSMIAALGAGLIQVQAAVARRQLSAVDTKRALYIAEAGLAEAFSAVCMGKTGAVGTPENPAEFGGGVYWITADEDAFGRITLDGVGLYGVGRFAVSAVVRRGVNPLGLQGMHGEQGVTVRAGAVVDGYDSSAGTYDDQLDPSLPFEATGGAGRISSNGDVVLEGDPFLVGDETFVFGDVYAGPEGLLTVDPDVQVSGSVVTLAERVDLPSIEVPDLGTAKSDVLVAPGSTTVLTGDARYRKINGSSGTVRVEGPARLHIGSLLFASGGRLEIDSSAGPVVLYVESSLQLPVGSTVQSLTQDPTGSALYMGPLAIGGLDLSAAGEFYGLMYGPRLDLVVPASLRVFGAVAGRSVTLAEGARLTYDVALATSDGLGIEVLPHLLSWKIDELPDDPLVKRRIDPLLQLDLRGTPPVLSNLAHRETVIQFTYKNGVGLDMTYVGDPALINWVGVSDVTGMQWQDPATLVYFPTPAINPTRLSLLAPISVF